jgi:hypothetical protein
VDETAVERYQKLAAWPRPTKNYLRRHMTHHSDCGCLTAAADAAIAELTAERDHERECRAADLARGESEAYWEQFRALGVGLSCDCYRSAAIEALEDA